MHNGIPKRHKTVTRGTDEIANKDKMTTKRHHHKKKRTMTEQRNNRNRLKKKAQIKTL